MTRKGQKGLSRAELKDRTISWTHILYQTFGGAHKPEPFSVPLWYELAGKPSEYTTAVFGRTLKILRIMKIVEQTNAKLGTTGGSVWTLLVDESDAQRRITEFFETGQTMASEAELETLERRRLAKAGKTSFTPRPGGSAVAQARKAHPTGSRIGDMTDFRQQPFVAEGGPIEHVYTGSASGPRGAEKVAPVAITAKPAEEVKAIAGPEPVKPLASLAALRPETINPLVEAARIYANRHKAIEASIDTQEKLASNLGIKFDRVAALASFTIETDPYMEPVTQVLPYITTLEQRVERLTAENTELRQYKRDHGALVNENERLKRRIKDMASERVVAAQAQAARGN